MADTTTPLDGLNLERLLELRRERRRIDAEIAALVTPLDATTTPTWGPCTRCGHVWRGKSADKPGHCAGCSSAYWDRERSRKRAEGRMVRKKRSRGRRTRTGLPLRVPIPPLKFGDIPPLPDGPPPPVMTPPPAAALSIVRPTPPPMWTPPTEEPQPEAVASPPPPLATITISDVGDEDVVNEGAQQTAEDELYREETDDVPHERDPDPSSDGPDAAE